MQRARGLSIFFPAYNDARSLPGLVEKAFAVGQDCAEQVEVIVVDDGSQDDTPRVLEELQRRYGPALRVIRHPANLGYGAALTSGFRAATKELVFYTDGDGQYDVGELRKLVEQVGPGVDWVNGYKISRSDPWYRLLIGRLYNFAVRRLFSLKLRDVDCDFRLIHRRVLGSLQLSTSSGAICVELAYQLQAAGANLVEVPVHHYPRLYGRSQFFRLPHLWRTVVDVVRLFINLVLVRKGLARRALLVRVAHGKHHG